MMLSLEEVRHIALLARISFTEEEIEKISSQLRSVVDYIGKLNEVDTSDTEPTSHVIPIHNVFRDDIIQSPFNTGEMLKNAPDANESFYIVPKIIE